MILISASLTLLFSFFILSLLRMPGRTANLLGGFLISFSHILAALLLAGLFRALSNQAVVLGIQVGLMAVSWLIWRLFGRPSLKVLLSGWRALLPMPAWRDTFYWLMGGGTLVAWLLNAILVWVVPPNNNDSLSTHLSRIGFWLQHSSYFPWPIINTKEVFYPINAALQVFWTVLFMGSDRLAGAIQWIGGLATIISVFGLARLLGFERRQALFAACTWAAMPIILLQSSTAQLDLIAAGIFLPVIYFLVLGVKSGKARYFTLSGLGLGLALGTKQTLFFLLPGLLLFALLLWKNWKKNPRLLVTWAVSSLGFFLLLSSPIYIINTVEFGTPLGPPEEVDISTGGQLVNFIYNVPRLAYQAVDFSGLPKPLDEWGIRAKAKVLHLLMDTSSFSLENDQALASGHQFDLRYYPLLQEDESWFGLLSTLLMFPAAFYGLWVGIRKRDTVRIGLIVFWLTFLPVNALLRPGWDPFQGRYFIPAFGAAAPLMAVWIHPKRFFALVKWISLALMLCSMGLTLMNNPAKPLHSWDINIWQANRSELQLQQGHIMWHYLYIINRTIPQDAVVGYYSQGYIWDYPLFGEHFSRKVVPIVEESQLGDLEWLQEQGIEFVMVNVSRGFPAGIHKYLVPADEEKGKWMLYTWTSLMP